MQRVKLMRLRDATLLWLAVMCLASDLAAQDDARGITFRQSGNSTGRVALVIGNSDYRDSPLRNPVSDARAMTEALRLAGFDVIAGQNLDQVGIKRAVREFGQKLRAGGTGLFYYAGHGVQVNGRNYLVPIDAEINSEAETEYEAVDVGFVLAQMEEAANGLNIVILDACRNNPFARSFRSGTRGLASIDAPTGSMIAYATAPGSVASDGAGSNGLYTQELLRFMSIPGLSIEEVFKQVRIAVREQTGGGQVPWESSSLVGDFYFQAGAPVAFRRSDESTGRMTMAELTDTLASMQVRLASTRSLMDNGDYGSVRSMLRPMYDRAAVLAQQFPTSRAAQDLKSKIFSLISEAQIACNAERQIALRRKLNPPMCDALN